ncbi:MAG: nuclear transport factor 2 family protein [Burkholderiaceae bacterium]|nr:nuclear transport factor 2 family protein [Burkholderiaceae bacterium]
MSENRPVKSQLLTADDARYAAMIAGDLASLERMLAPQLLYCHSSGHVDTRESYLAALESGRIQYLGVHRYDEIVHPVDGVALMCGFHHLRVRLEGEEKTLHNRFTTTWLHDEGRWLLLAWASTPVPAPVQSSGTGLASA